MEKTFKKYILDFINKDDIKIAKVFDKRLLSEIMNTKDPGY